MGPPRQVQGGQRCALCEDHHDAQSGMSSLKATLSLSQRYCVLINMYMSTVLSGGVDT